MGTITAWLANKLAAPILLALLILALVSVGVQTVRIYGISFFGLYAVDGYKPMYEAADKRASKSESNYQTCRANSAKLQAAIDKQNAVIAANSASDQAALATAHQKVADALKKAAASQAKLAAFMAHAPAGATVCAKVEDIDHRFMETLP